MSTRSDDAVHCAAAAYFSDMALLGTAWLGHRHRIPSMRSLAPASLCHSVWFHRPFRADQWLLHAMVRPWPAVLSCGTRLPRLPRRHNWARVTV